MSGRIKQIHNDRKKIKRDFITLLKSLHNVPASLKKELADYIALVEKEHPDKLTDRRLCKMIACVFLGIPTLWATGNKKGIDSNKKLLDNFAAEHLQPKVESKTSFKPR